MKTEYKLKGVPLARDTLKFIIEHPKKWEQRNCVAMTELKRKSCGCFMHWAGVLAGIKYTGVAATRNAIADALGISGEDFNTIYGGSNSLARLKVLCRDTFGIKRIKLSKGKTVQL